MPAIILRADKLVKCYGNLIAVDNLSLEILQGEILGLLGPNGAGKTTAINMLCGLLPPDAGQVFIHGESVHGGSLRARTRVGVCPQETILWEKLTCIEQLEFVGEMYAMHRRAACQRGDELLDTLGLSDKRNQLAATLSGGMKRRLNLALALIHDPEILILDEPEAGLDPQSRIMVREYIRSLAREKTIILTTHNMDEAERMADRVAIMDHGKLLKLDTPDALKHSIGAGDILEIAVQNIALEQVLAVTQPFAAEAALTNGKIILRGHNMVEKIPALIERLRQAGTKIGEVHLRANTLEDVFIALTGRRLRQ
ncbi:MAG: ABC transporter ATP-binding protein [Anaerolineae bacterium]|nr:ABC transporter ATP-binding protein [Anaerolineae bacterium]MBL6965585.1 ABC transporter ATP-binding protein [Anaerolineales bacterium]